MTYRWLKSRRKILSNGKENRSILSKVKKGAVIDKFMKNILAKLQNINPRIIPIVLISLIAIAATYIWTSCNHLQKKNTDINAKWLQLETQLQYQHDLSPALVSTIKDRSDYDTTTLENISELRYDRDIISEQAAYRKYNTYIETLENDCPGIKTEERYIAFTKVNAKIQDNITAVIENYNNAASSLNASMKSFPHKIIADISGVNEKSFLKRSKKYGNGVL